MDRPELAAAPPPPAGVADGASPPAPTARSANAVNALIHLYRAEVGRMTAYRQRLDTTTNWGITSSALVTTFAMGNHDIPHMAFLFLMFINFFFLVVESRRFRAYETARYRVLLLERSFYPDVLGRGVDPRWTEPLIHSLRTAYPTVDFIGAMGWRLRRNYLWIYGAVLLTWIGKLDIVGGPIVHFPLDFVQRAAIGSVPGLVVWVLVVAGYACLGALALLAERHYPLGDEGARAMMADQAPD